MFVVEASDESAKRKRQPGVAGFQMSSGVLQKVILLHRCVVITPEAVLEFRQLPGEWIDHLGGKKMAEALQEIAHFFTINADRMNDGVRRIGSDCFGGFANAAEAFQDSFAGDLEDGAGGISRRFDGMSRSPGILERCDLVFVGVGAEKLRNQRGLAMALRLEFLEERVQPPAKFLGEHVFEASSREEVDIVIAQCVCPAAQVADLPLPSFCEVLGKDAFHLSGYGAEFAEGDAEIVEKFRVDIFDDALLVPAGDGEQAAEDFEQDGAGMRFGGKCQAELQRVGGRSHPADFVGFLNKVFMRRSATEVQQCHTDCLAAKFAASDGKDLNERCANLVRSRAGDSA